MNINDNIVELWMTHVLDKWERVRLLEGLPEEDKLIVAMMMESCVSEFLLLDRINSWKEYLEYNPDCGWDLQEVKMFIETATFAAIRRLVEKEGYKGHFSIFELVKTLQKKYIEFKEKFKDNEDMVIDVEAEACAWGAHEFAEMMKVK